MCVCEFLITFVISFQTILIFQTMEDTIAIRLKLFLDSTGLSSTQFADMCGIPRPSFSQLLSGRNKKVSDVVLTQIHNTFPDISMNWLLFGEGPVRVSAGSKGKEQATFSDSSSKIPSGNSTNDLFSPFDTPDNEIDMSENSPEPISTTKYNQNLNLKGLNQGVTTSQQSGNKDVDSEIKILDLKRQIENLKENPRKVIQITIYYDDSTFETFVPRK